MTAQVNDFEAIERVREQFALTTQRFDDGLVQLEGELRRFIDWVEDDRPRYWREAIHRATDGVAQARAELSRAMMFPAANGRPACSEQRAALKRAEERLRYCEMKRHRVADWSRELRRELVEYQGRIGQLRAVVDTDLPAAVAALGQMLASLEKYLQLTTGAAPPRAEAAAPPPAASPAATTPREVPDETV